MLPGDKNLKDSGKDIKDNNVSIPAPYQTTSFGFVSYTKTHKLITALYMVTDMIESAEPIRHKLRNLGAEIVSDMHSVPIKINTKVAEVLSFLDIASAMNFISEMNYAILKKEFLELNRSIQEHTDAKPKWLTEFFTQDDSIGHVETHKGHQIQTRIGVQKGSTLMKALSDKINFKSESVPHTSSRFKDFDLLKKERRFNIINIIKNIGGNATIKDIRNKINEGKKGADVCGEKTLQRELVSMIKDGVLDKTGEKRWSRYFLASRG